MHQQYAMSPTTLFNKLKLNLALDMLPKESWSMEILEQILEIETLPTFSNYFPHVVSDVIVKTTEDNRVEGRENVYYLYDEDNNYFGKEVLILGIMQLDTIVNRNRNTTYTGYDAMYGGFGGGLETMLMNVAMSGITSLLQSGSINRTYEYLPPNMVKIFSNVAYSNGLTAGTYYADVMCTHSKNLSSIPHTKLDFFYKLFESDVKSVLYERLKHFEGLETAYGTTSLKIDAWQDSDKSRRNDIIQEMKSTYLLDNQPKVIAL